MMLRYLAFLSTLLLIPAASTAAVNVVQCEDEQGEITFQKSCPPGTTEVGKKRISTGTSSDGNENDSENAGGPEISALLYTTSECGPPCDRVREYLAARNVTITEKNATEDWEVQNEIKQLIGDLKVPVTKIGNNTITGYNEAALRTALNAAGYTEPESTETEDTSVEP
ncbi:MAG: glutaredoxin family protein [Gammaproteobacteria bacterium]